MSDTDQTDLATLRKLDWLQKEVRTVMSIAPDETAMPGCECQRCRIIRALTDGAAGKDENRSSQHGKDCKQGTEKP
jgi:hypothetical protein